VRSEDYEYLYNIEETYWWFVAMRRITDAIISSEIPARPLVVLDAGCGTGYNIHHFESKGHTVFAFDLAEEAIARVRRRGLRKICRASAAQIPFASDKFDLALSFEVMDELSLDKAQDAFREIHRVLKPGGSFFVRLPAFEWMRSTHDDDIQTVHRYTSGELRGMLRGAGFEVRFSSYANALLFPVVLLKRSLKKIGIGRGTDTKPLPRGLQWIDPIFRSALGVEARVLGARRSLPFGLSVICLARKPHAEGVRGA
jgi:SAM-dependent methyltransferase